MDNTDVKLKVSHAVTKWEMDSPFEYSAFLSARRSKTDGLANAFAEVPGQGFIERLLYEVPEGLYAALRMALDDGERAFLQSKEGAQWFTKTFMQYNVSQKT